MNEEVLQLEDKHGTEIDIEFYLEEVSSHFTQEQKEVLEVLVRCPSCVKVNGTINKSKIAKKLDKKWHEVDQIVQSLEGVLEKS